MADMGTDNYEQEFTLGLVEKDRNLLREINSALAKIQNGTFGICEGTGKPIGKPRARGPALGPLLDRVCPQAGRTKRILTRVALCTARERTRVLPQGSGMFNRA